LNPGLQRVGFTGGTIAADLGVLRVLEQETDGHPSIGVLRSEYEARIRSGERTAAATGTDETRMTQLQRRAVMAQRQALMSLRARKVIGDDAFHAAEEEVDLLELTADSRIRPGPDSTTPSA